MKENDSTWKQLIRYVEGECPREETRAIARWIKSNPVHKKIISFVRSIWGSKVEDPSLKGKRFTGLFTTRQPLEEVLDAIALSLDISYSKKDSTIIFQNKNTN